MEQRIKMNIQFDMIEEIDVTDMDVEDKFFEQSVKTEYSVSSVEMTDGIYYEFENYVKTICVKQREMVHDERMSKVEFWTYSIEGTEHLVIIFFGPIAYVATGTKWLMTKFVEDFNKKEGVIECQKE